jgi:sulfur-carrier protein
VTEIRVVLPVHLRNLARTGKEVTVSVPAAGDGVTQRAVLDALELAYPVLLGTIRDRHTGKRRAFVRFYACEQDLSNDAPDAPLPAAVAAALAAGTEPFLVVGAMAGG